MTQKTLTTVEILTKLVGFDTTSGKSNLALVEWIENYLRGFGVEVQILPHGSEERVNILATIKSSHKPGIVLSGHTDVVPADNNAWSSDPFILREQSGRLYGRGTTDMKGFLSSVLAAVPDMLAADLAMPLHIAFSCDEEIGCQGVPHLIENLPPTQLVIVGEPTKFQIIDQHKGAHIQILKFKGIPAHSGTPDQGVNAIEFASEFLMGIQNLRETFNQTKQSDARQIVITATDIYGGSAPNIIPETCSLTLLTRAASPVDEQIVDSEIASLIAKTRAAMRAQNAASDIEIQTICNVPSLISKPKNRARELCQTLTGKNKTIDIGFTTEAGLFQRSGHSAVVCGPGDMTQGHTIDEYIEIEQLVQADQFLNKVIAHVAR